MSRETDSSSSGPQGRGGAAYPSGTPPYGTRQYPSLHPQEEQHGGDAGESPAAEAAPAPAVREPKTETTLTTRVRINIPGSRPIPPVVLRTPVAEGKDGGAGKTDAAPAPATPPAPEPPAGEATQTQAMPRWTPPGSAGSTAGGAAPGTPGSGAPSFGAPGAAPGAGAPGFGAPGANGVGGEAEKPAPSDWFAPRKSSAGGSQTGSTPYPAPEDPGPPMSTTAAQPFPPHGVPAPGAPAAPGPAPTGGATAGGGTPGTPPLANIPYLTENPPTGRPPAPGDSPFPGAQGADPYGLGDPEQGAGPQADPAHGSVPFSGFHTPGQAGRPHLGDTEPPAGPTTGPVTGGLRPPAPESRSGYRPARGGTGTTPVPGVGDGQDHVSGATLTSGIPLVPPPGPAAGAKTGSRASRPARKGRSKPMLAVVALVSVAVVGYAAGLLMDHADVPNGTVVLGVNIGGDSREQATKALDAAAGQRTNAPLALRVGGQQEELKPELAGLSIDTDSTIEQVAHRDYNPISVISSLFGGTHVVAPAIKTDQEKLRSQLQALGALSGSGSDGMVKFVAGTPVAVPGKPYQAVDADASTRKISQAYTQRAETGSDAPVVLPVTTHQPQVTQATLEQAIKTIGDPAMSGLITVSAGGHSVPFSPQKSLSKILTIVPVPGTGKMALHIDLPLLQSLYGNAFDGVLLERGNGSKTAVTPADVASAMLPELNKTAASKTAVISNVAG